MNVGDLSTRDEIPPLVRFEQRPMESRAESVKAGHSVSIDIDFAMVTPAFSKDLHEEKWETWIAKKEVEARNGRTRPEWVDHWKKAYSAWKQGLEIPENGTPIKTWSAISPAQIKNLIEIGITTVEQLAGVNDEGLARIGSGGVRLKQTARNWLDDVKNHGENTLRITELEMEVNRLKAANESLIEKNKMLMSQIEAVRAQPVHSTVVTDTITAEDILDETPDEFEYGEVPVVAEENKINPDDFRRPNFSDYSDDALREAFEKEFDRKPGRMLRENMIDRLTNLHR